MDTSLKPESKRLFIGSLPYKYTEGQLLDLFNPFGRVISIRIIHNQWGKSRGIGYVEFEDIKSAVNAKVQLHNKFVEDRSIIVDYAQPDPLLTPEGQKRHLEAIERKPSKRAFYKTQLSLSVPKKKSTSKDRSVRQTVFNSRNFHSKTGSKFSSRGSGRRK